ncbi:hypothetical protein [Pelagibacterium lentulum]|uniref:Uncharacterized protein n=1 Tax=Pelagibacterium lentulum TaxID=2029865 RepID=A0A916VYA4_9HYPH|nr:hypothetical protein [Pelagibacterium lentulum]GGA51701.1 hypothetical protein GCM10011499_22200 [Pelagibacterium lentulum]
MQIFFGIAYLVVGLVQLFAIMDGISAITSITGFFAFMIALFVTYIPLLGAGLGVYGAITVWDWPLLQASLLFFWYVPVFLILAIADGIFSRRTY